jgi:DNA-binding beta-propeller fold protein YncE
VYVADTNNNRIQKFDGTGEFLAKFGDTGNEEGSFSLPEGVAVDSEGNVYVADTNNNRIQKFDDSGIHVIPEFDLSILVFSSSVAAVLATTVIAVRRAKVSMRF